MPKLVCHANGGLEVRRAYQAFNRDGFRIARNADMRDPALIAQRDGYDLIAADIDGGGTISPYQVLSRHEALLVRSGRALYAYDSANSEWDSVGIQQPVEVDVRVYAPTVRNQTQASVTVLGDYALTCWTASKTGSTKVWYSVTRISDRVVLVDETSLTSSGTATTHPMVVAGDDYWLIVYLVDTGNGSVRCRRVPVAALDTPTSEVTLRNLSTAIPAARVPLDAVPDTSGQVYVMCLDVVATVETVYLWLLDDSTTVASNNFTSTNAADRSPVLVYESSTPRLLACGVASDDQTLEVNRVNTSTLAKIDANTHTLDGTDTFDRITGIAVDADTAVIVASEESSSASQDYEVYTEVVTVDMSSTPAFVAEAELTCARLCHRPFVVSSVTYLPVMVNAAVSQTAAFVLYDLDNRVVVARWYEGGRAFNAGYPYVHASVSGTTVKLSAPFQGRALVEGGLYFLDTGVGLVTLDLSLQRSASIQYADLCLWLSGGFINAYDGREVIEADWHALPEVTLSAAGSGGSLSAGDYSYAVYWEWEDGAGRVHRSAPTIVNVTAVTNDQVTVTVHGHPHSRKSDLQFRVARSLVGDATTFYVLNDADYDSPSDTSATYVDSASDTAIQSLSQYDQAGSGAVQPNEAVPAARFLTSENGRLWWGDPEFPELIHFSTKCVSGLGPGIVGVTASPTHVVAACDGQPITAMGQLDGQHCGFSEQGVILWTGDGPSRISGGPGGYSEPIVMPSTLGTTSQFLLARTNEGLAYVSPRGPRLLGREIASNSPYDAIAELWTQQGADSSRLLYLPLDEETLVFDQNAELLLGPTDHPPQTARYSHKTSRWSTDSGSQAIDAHQTDDGRVFFIRQSDSRVCQFVSTTKQRGGVNATMVLVTNWLSPEPYGTPMVIRGVAIEGQYIGETIHEIKVAMAYDYDDRFTDETTIDTFANPWRSAIADVDTPPDWMRTGKGYGYTPSDAGSPPTSGTRYQYNLSVRRQCYAVSVAVWFESTGEPGPQLEAAATISAVIVEVDVRSDDAQRLPRLPGELGQNAPS